MVGMVRQITPAILVMTRCLLTHCLRWFTPVAQVREKAEVATASTQTEDLFISEWVREKSGKVGDKRYIEPGFVLILTRFFAVPKGEENVRMVYNDSISSMNSKLWAPSFPLPTVESHLRATTYGSWMGDVGRHWGTVLELCST